MSTRLHTLGEGATAQRPAHANPPLLPSNVPSRSRWTPDPGLGPDNQRSSERGGKMSDADPPAAESAPDVDADLAPIENPAADIAAASEAASAEETATTEGTGAAVQHTRAVTCVRCRSPAGLARRRRDRLVAVAGT